MEQRALKHPPEVAVDTMWVRAERKPVLPAFRTPYNFDIARPLVFSRLLSLKLNATCVIKSEDQTEVSSQLFTRVES